MIDAPVEGGHDSRCHDGVERNKERISLTCKGLDGKLGSTPTRGRFMSCDVSSVPIRSVQNDQKSIIRFILSCMSYHRNVVNHATVVVKKTCRTT